MSDSPHEYIEELKTQNKALRSTLVQMCREREILQHHIAQQDIRIKELTKAAGRAPHDWEPGPWRAGIEDVD